MTWSMSIKNKKTKGYCITKQSIIQDLEFLGSSKKKNFVSFSTNNDMYCESFKWRFLAQRCSFVRVSYIYTTRLVIREKKISAKRG